MQVYRCTNFEACMVQMWWTSHLHFPKNWAKRKIVDATAAAFKIKNFIMWCMYMGVLTLKHAWCKFGEPSTCSFLETELNVELLMPPPPRLRLKIS